MLKTLTVKNPVFPMQNPKQKNVTNHYQTVSIENNAGLTSVELSPLFYIHNNIYMWASHVKARCNSIHYFSLYIRSEYMLPIYRDGWFWEQDNKITVCLWLKKMGFWWYVAPHDIYECVIYIHERSFLMLCWVSARLYTLSSPILHAQSNSFTRIKMIKTTTTSTDNNKARYID